jgi:hypothetical protein
LDLPEDEVRTITLEEIQQHVRELAAQLGAEGRLLPTYGHSRDGGHPHIEIDPSGRMHFVVVERGQELERLTYFDLDELLYRIFESVTFSMAGQFELKHREPYRDSRRIAFAKQVELLGSVSAAWAERLAARHEEILERYRFRDDETE